MWLQVFQGSHTHTHTHTHVIKHFHHTNNNNIFYHSKCCRRLLNTGITWRQSCVKLWEPLPSWTLRGGGPVGWWGDCWHTAYTSFCRDISALMTPTAGTAQWNRKEEEKKMKYTSRKNTRKLDRQLVIIPAGFIFREKEEALHYGLDLFPFKFSDFIDQHGSFICCANIIQWTRV